MASLRSFTIADMSLQQAAGITAATALVASFAGAEPMKAIGIGATTAGSLIVINQLVKKVK